MSRVEENEGTLKEVDEIYETAPRMAAESRIAAHLGMIRVVLSDISNSLAVIADTLSAERNKDHE